MGGTYQQNKTSIYNWIEKNKDKHRENSRIGMAKVRMKKLEWKIIKQEYLLILLED